VWRSTQTTFRPPIFTPFLTTFEPSTIRWARALREARACALVLFAEADWACLAKALPGISKAAISKPASTSFRGNLVTLSISEMRREMQIAILSEPLRPFE
jgi:hypothetical protein